MTPRELERLTEYPVFHNNLVVDMLTVRFPFGSAEFVALREQIWITVFAEAARINRSLIFTFAPEATVQPGVSAPRCRCGRVPRGEGGPDRRRRRARAPHP